MVFNISQKKVKTTKTKKIDHISIAVKDLDRARKAWEPIIGKTEPDDSYVDESEKIRVARYWLGNVGFELMESTTPDGPVAKCIEKNGEGVMIVSFNVDNTLILTEHTLSCGFTMKTFLPSGFVL